MRELRSGRSRRARRRDQLVGRIGRAFTVVSALAGGAWALVEFSSNRESGRVEYTLQLIDAWEKDGYSEAYNALREAYRNFIVALPESDRLTASTSSIGRANILALFADEMAKDKERPQQIRKIVYFFNRLSLCELSEVCSHETVRIFFDDTVQSFVAVFQPYIDKNAEMLPGNRRTVAELADRLNRPDTSPTP